MNDVVRMRLLLGAAMLFALLVVPVALAGASGDSGGGPAGQCEREHQQEDQEVDHAGERPRAAARGAPGGAGRRPPPSGAAGGDLTGSYPNPLIAGDAVGPGDIANPTRSVNLPIGSFVNETDSAIDFAASDGTAPDFGSSGFGSLGIEWDSTATGVADTDFVTSTFVVRRTTRRVARTCCECRRMATPAAPPMF